MQSLLEAVQGKYGTILIDPPWRFANRTGKMAPEHKRLHRYRHHVVSRKSLPYQSGRSPQRKATCTCGVPMRFWPRPLAS